MAGRNVPTRNTTYVAPADWLPKPKVRFDALVDHLSRSILGRPSTPALLAACCTATGCEPANLITKAHPMVRWHFLTLLTVFFDAPGWFYR